MLHLLHRFNLEDPAIPISLPNVRWLPLYCVFDGRADRVGYRLLSEGLLETFFPAEDVRINELEAWPDENYPQEFPQSEIAVSSYPYDPRDLEDAYRWSGIYGVDKLSRADRDEAQRRVCDEMEEFGLGRPETEEEYAEAFTNPFMQGKPRNPCLNPNCGNHNSEGELEVITLMSGEPVKGVHLFGRWGGGVTIIFELCPLCFTVNVSNECS